MLYAIAVGCGPEGHDFIHESGGPQVLPGFFGAVAYADACDVVVEQLGLSGYPLIHGDLELTRFDDAPPRGTLHNALRIERVHDAGTSAAIDVVCLSQVDGRLIAETRIGFFAVGAGGFGGNGARPIEPLGPPDRTPDRTRIIVTRPEQSYLYRLSFLQPLLPALGDEAPCSDPHIDVAAAKSAGFPGPVLHGVCTFGLAALGLGLELEAAGKPAWDRIAARFTAPAYPGDTLQLNVWEEAERWLFELVGPDESAVVSNAAVYL